MFKLCTICLVFALNRCVAKEIKRPHVVFVLADDLGYNDIGYNAREHGSQISTPFLDEMAAQGVRLENYYTQSTCSPSRSQLMSGRYQIHTGLQHKLRAGRRHGLPLENKIIPEQLKSCGYDTHMVGKWHLGFFRWDYTPLYRGFNSFFGLLNSGADYYTHAHTKGGAMWNNTEYTNASYGRYSTHIFTDQAAQAIERRDKTKPFFLYLSHQAVHSPLQVPEEYAEPFAHIENQERRTYAGMVLTLDESVKNVSQQLEKAGMLNDTIFIFSSDNGGTPRFGGNNWPLRGKKDTLFEGGVKAVGFISGRPLGISGVKSYNFMHISDWLPTILGATGCPLRNDTPPLDGFDQWNAILQREKSPRTELLHALDPKRKARGRKFVHGFNVAVYAAIRSGPWKLITGQPRLPTRDPPPESGLEANDESSVRREYVRLYHIESDPYESYDVSSENVEVVESLIRKLKNYKHSSVPVWYPRPDKKGNPRDNGVGYWKPWVLDN